MLNKILWCTFFFDRQDIIIIDWINTCVGHYLCSFFFCRCVFVCIYTVRINPKLALFTFRWGVIMRTKCFRLLIPEPTIFDYSVSFTETQHVWLRTSNLFAAKMCVVFWWDPYELSFWFTNDLKMICYIIYFCAFECFFSPLKGRYFWQKSIPLCVIDNYKLHTATHVDERTYRRKFKRTPNKK